MRTNTAVMLLAAAGLLFTANLAGAAEKRGKPLNERPLTDVLSDPRHEKALRSRAEQTDATPREGRLRDPEGITDRAERDDSAGRDPEMQGEAKSGPEE